MRRRHFLQSGALGSLAALAAMAVRAAQAQPSQQSKKLTKFQAGYAEEATSDKSCANCIYWVTPDSCVIVEGPISLTATCDYFGQ